MWLWNGKITLVNTSLNMTQEEKNILLKDLCARSLYGVKVCVRFNKGSHYKANITAISIDSDYIQIRQNDLHPYTSSSVEDIRPYLRPLESMTEEEYKELKEISPDYGFSPFERIDEWSPNYEIIDWLNAHHFDYRGLIFMELALEAPEGMYETE